MMNKRLSQKWISDNNYLPKLDGSVGDVLVKYLEMLKHDLASVCPLVSTIEP